jgi:hypothetical protein
VDIFLSWSQPRSEAVAKALHAWIPLVLQPARPWLSRDIEKGARWDDVISRKLESCDFGIVCLTPENLHSDWLLFEAGALSKKVNDARVCTYLLDLKPSDVTGPLSKFQHTTVTKDDTRALLFTLNAILAELGLDSDRFRQTFDQWWPELEQRLAAAESQPVATLSAARGTEDKIDEILLTVRTLEARLQRTARLAEIPQGSSVDAVDALSKTDWSELTPRLLAFALSRSRDAGLRHSATSVSNAVQTAIQEVLDGRHEWRASAEKSLFEFLCGVVETVLKRDAETDPAK